MNELKGQMGVLTATVTVVRKGTGKVETYNLTSEPVTSEQAATILGSAHKEKADGGHALDSK
jgi:hypothetical protein